MSGECDKCGEHAWECKCENIKNRNTLACLIMECILKCEPEKLGHLPDALIQVFVHLAYKNEWSLERTQNEVASAIGYYYNYELQLDTGEKNVK